MQTKSYWKQLLIHLIVFSSALASSSAKIWADETQSAAPYPELQEFVDGIAEKALESGSVAGLSIGIAQGDTVLLAKAYGFADLEHSVPATEKTVYRIGSVTKQFTAAAILLLAQEGLLSLDDPITKFLPDYPMQGHTITILHLLQHTSGIKSFTDLPSYKESLRQDATHEEILERFQHEPLLFEPGTQHSYCNAGYFLLGMILEHITEQKYADFLQQRFFEPLGMDATCYDNSLSIIANRARGYSFYWNQLHNGGYVSMTQPFSAGALLSTVEDLIAWQRGLVNNRFLTAESFARMSTPGTLNNGDSFNYGCGLYIGDLDGKVQIYHGGGIIGFRSHLAYYPEGDFTVAVLENSESRGWLELSSKIGKYLITHAADAQVYDVLIRNGMLIDGTGAARKQMDVGIKDGRITLVGDAQGATADSIIDGQGLVVAPGFIDVHNHSTPLLIYENRKLNEGFLYQGVTTVVGGPDGRHAPSELRSMIDAYAKQGVGNNIAFYVGHNGIRKQVMGDSQQRVPTAEELQAMKVLVREGMELGAVGLSTGLMYEPGMFSDMEEIVELAKEIAPFHGIYDSHVRDPVRSLEASFREAAEIGKRAGVAVKFGHVTCVGPRNEGKMHEVIALAEEYRAAGHVVYADQYPYDGVAVRPLNDIIIVPPSLQSDDPKNLELLLADLDKRAILRDTSEHGIDGGFAWLKASEYSAMRIVSSPDFPQLVGKHLSIAASDQGIEPFDLVAKLILTAKYPVAITLGAINEQDVRELLVQPWNMIASDGQYLDAQMGKVPGHPRNTGTFPRVLGRYVRDEGLLSLEEAIRKMSLLPAQSVGLRDRGQIAEGMAADIVIFDENTIRDRSTWDEPWLMSEGVQYLIVNGGLVLSEGKLTGAAPGRYLWRQDSAPTP